MLETGEKLGAFIVPTGLGASIGGYAGDASCQARAFAEKSKLIVNPNVVNAGVFSGISCNMLYTEGFIIDEFFKGMLGLIPSKHNKIGVVFDRAIPENVLNIHLNTIGAVTTVYGIDVYGYEITKEEAGVEFYVDENGFSTGCVKNIETVFEASEKLLNKGCGALAIVCYFEDPEGDNEDYANGSGVDPVGGVEGIISHAVSQKFLVPCAHSPAFEDVSISSTLVNPKAAAEYITPTFLPCVLLGLNNAPKIIKESGIRIENLDYLVMPYNSLGSTPVFEALKRDIKIFAVKENTTVLDVTKDNFFKSGRIIEVETYEKCLELI